MLNITVNLWRKLRDTNILELLHESGRESKFKVGDRRNQVKA
jgi:hypothetical protein